MPKLFSCVVDHDHGYAPCPYLGFSTLAKCEYGSKKWNIVEWAEEGDWIAGTGGADLSKSAGDGKLICAMRVDEETSLRDYCRNNRGNRIDAEGDVDEDGRFVPISCPNYIPLPTSAIGRVVQAVELFEYDRVNGACWDMVTEREGKPVVKWSSR